MNSKKKKPSHRNDSIGEGGGGRHTNNGNDTSGRARHQGKDTGDRGRKRSRGGHGQINPRKELENCKSMNAFKVWNTTSGEVFKPKWLTNNKIFTRQGDKIKYPPSLVRKVNTLELTNDDPMYTNINDDKPTNPIFKNDFLNSNDRMDWTGLDWTGLN